MEVNPDGLLTHEYELPVTAVAPIGIVVIVQIFVLAIVAAAGIGLTFIVNEFVLLHPFELDSIKV